MVQEEGDGMMMPASPNAQYLKSSALSLTILGVLESENPINDSQSITLLHDLFLPINPRFSSIMVEDSNGRKKWKRVNVQLADHIRVPTFPEGLSVDAYDDCFKEYISSIAMEPLPDGQPLWEVHIIKYPTRNAAGNLVFKLHHALGDGYSLMGALLSCMQRFDDPSLPLTFPSRALSTQPAGDGKHAGSLFRSVLRVFSAAFATVEDIRRSVLKSTLQADVHTPIKSGDAGVEFRPLAVSTVTFSLRDIKHIKNKLHVTINDVITGIIAYGTRLYMHEEEAKSSKTNVTVLVLLNTRGMVEYKTVNEMVKPNTKTPWGNHFAFLQISLPKLTPATMENPLQFVFKSHKLIKRQKNSLAVYFTGWLLETIRKVRGPEATARYIHRTLKNSSMTVTNIIGPVEKMALSNQSIKGIYFAVAGSPQNLEVTVVSYMGNLRIALVVDKGYIDIEKYQSCIQKAFDNIFEAAKLHSDSATK